MSRSLARDRVELLFRLRPGVRVSALRSFFEFSSDPDLDLDPFFSEFPRLDPRGAHHQRGLQGKTGRVRAGAAVLPRLARGFYVGFIFKYGYPARRRAHTHGLEARNV